MPATERPDLLADFEAGRIDPAHFPHRDHVRVSYELLERHPFPEALLHLARGLRRLAAKAGQAGGLSRNDHGGVSRTYRRAALTRELCRLSRLRGAKSGSFLQGIVEQVLRAGCAPVFGCPPDLYPPAPNRLRRERNADADRTELLLRPVQRRRHLRISNRTR